MLLAIPNLQSHVAFEVLPWEFKPEIPEGVKSNKAEFIKWCQKPSTKNCHFSAVQGLNPLRRVGADNPVVCLRGLIADYDAACTEEMFAAVVEDAPTEFPPNWGSSTFSGGARLVWMFDEPLYISDSGMAKGFLKLAKRKLKISAYFPGLDEEAFSNASKYYERGSDWRMLSGDKIPTNMLWQWLYEAGNKRTWRNKNEVNIPMNEIAKEVQRQYPNRWKGEFAEGIRGHRFWAAEASNETAAVIRATGMQCFTGGQGFVPWSEILGIPFIERYQANTIGAIVSGFYYDGNAYWHKTEDKIWRQLPKEDMRLALKVKYTLRNYPDKSETSSEVD